MVSPNLITLMSPPSNQGNVPALASSTGQEGCDHVLGTPYDAPPPSWQYVHGQSPEARAVPLMFTP
eukprot:12885312-Prorocentrum_lima.AAC.1